MRKRLLPAPLLSAALFAFWLLLNESLSPGQLLTAAIVALVVPWLVASLRPMPVRVRHPIVLLRLIVAVGHDVVESSLQVAAGVLRSRPPRSAFVTIPLELRDAHALASLAIITTVVPGTVWSELAADRSAVRLHVFDVADADAFIAFYKRRYERPLLEIFE
jgi:multicomponent K+:H+ antiporter subunit E